LLEECIAQALFLMVLVAAVHWGSKAGTITAVVAILAYGGIRTPWLLREGISGDMIGLILVRTLTYGVVGIAGGALCSRVRYLLARLESNSSIDDATGVFNQRFISEMLLSMVGQYERYHKTFSVVILSLLRSDDRPAEVEVWGAEEDLAAIAALCGATLGKETGAERSRRAA
jgi:hypothetical protein